MLSFWVRWFFDKPRYKTHSDNFCAKSCGDSKFKSKLFNLFILLLLANSSLFLLHELPIEQTVSYCIIYVHKGSGSMIFVESR